MELSTALLLGFFLLALLWWKKSHPKGLPPGPAPLPLLGNILQMDFSNLVKGLKKFSEEYGPVYTIYIGATPAVVVRGLKDLKEILVNKGHDFADRPYTRLINDISETKGLIVAPYGPAWKEHRRFTLSTLRDFGLGKKSMEEKICEESVHLIQEFKKNKDTLLDPHLVIDNAVSNITCMIVFGRRYEYNDSTFRDILNLMHENMNMSAGFWAQLYNAFGFVKHLPLPHRRIFRNVKVFFAFLEKVLSEHKRTRVSGQPRDYIDCYLDELEKEQEERKSTFNNENLFICVSDLFIAGTETTSSTLEWCLLYMMMYPDIQEKCREEIDKIRGDRDHLDYKDRLSMPYTQAALQEVQRFASVVPLGVAHAPIKDIQLNGFTIPKRTMVITDLSSVNYDEKQWKYPHEFNPENFLDSEGDLLKVDGFLPFSAGPRVCLGENLARMEIFLYFTSLLTHFEFHWPDPKSPPDTTPVCGITQVPKRYKMRLVSREKS
ncbi:cytochrome P450 2B4-like [Ranitomeya variabilis]|uniref:cytochrome P450 2B4-like n=1 Tax=Ranitomeya variabilis TaxID=490064 RepID=UPI004057A2D8